MTPSRLSRPVSCARSLLVQVLEETGISVTDVRFATAENSVFAAQQKHYVTVFMLASAPQDAEPQLLEPDKCTGWRWIDWALLQQLKSLFQPLQQLVDRGYAP
jgi:8-oxo-dGTP diphosphatase